MQITIKLEGVQNLEKLWAKKRKEIIDGGERVIKQHNQKILQSAKSKIHHISGETAASLKAEVVLKGQGVVVSRIGTLGGTKEEAIRANSLEYGHAAPGNAGGVKVVPPYPFMRPATEEDRSLFKKDMKNEIQRVIEK